MPVRLQWRKADLWLPGESGEAREGWDGGVRGPSQILQVMDTFFIMIVMIASAVFISQIWSNSGV